MALLSLDDKKRSGLQTLSDLFYSRKHDEQ